MENAPRNRGVSVDRRGAIVPITAVIHTKASVGLHLRRPRLQKTSVCRSCCTHTVPGTAACGHGADSGDRHEYAACLALTCICDSWRPSSAARMRMLRQASSIGSTTGRVRRRLFGRSVPEDRSLWQESPAMFRDSCSTFEPGTGKTAWCIIPWFQSWFLRTTLR